jgi:adapter protein MecA 1/2
MKIEKVNDNQIRCILSKEDLDDRQLKISEIAYGSDKAKLLLKDVMQQASYEYGFEADNIPLMIEAIPMNTGCVVFIITKVQNPEELDTRFSRFAPSVMEGDSDGYDDEYDDEDSEDGFDEIFDNEEKPAPANPPAVAGSARIEIVGTEALQSLIENLGNENVMFDLFKKITSSAQAANAENEKKPIQGDNDSRLSDVRLFVFDDLETVGRACRILNESFNGQSTLYKNPDDEKFYLVLNRGDEDKKDFLKMSNILIEYGSHRKYSPTLLAKMEEHYKCLVKGHAVQSMAQF